MTDINSSISEKDRAIFYGRDRDNLISAITLILRKLPNGLLVRLLKDATFYYEWRLCKTKARKSSRLNQMDGIVLKMEEKYWKGIDR
jgi:hypothetical protein